MPLYVYLSRACLDKLPYSIRDLKRNETKRKETKQKETVSSHLWCSAVDRIAETEAKADAFWQLHEPQRVHIVPVRPAQNDFYLSTHPMFVPSLSS